MPYGPTSSLATTADPAVGHRRQPLLAHAAVNARPVALVYRVIAFALILAGGVRNSGVLSGAPDWSTLLFYTMISNLLSLGWMLVLIIRTAWDLRRRGTCGTSTPSARGSGAVMMAITVTMLIYLIVLVPTRFQQGDAEVFSLTDNLIHVITPCLVIGDWLLFVPKGTFRWIDPLRWTLIPYAYLVFGFIYGALGGDFTPGQTYPYPFMNIEKLGLGGVALWIVALLPRSSPSASSSSPSTGCSALPVVTSLSEASGESSCIRLTPDACTAPSPRPQSPMDTLDR